MFLIPIRYEEYVFEKDLFPPKPSYEQTNIFILSCAACVVASIVFSKGAPYRKHLFTNGNISLASSRVVAVNYFFLLFQQHLLLLMSPNPFGVFLLLPIPIIIFDTFNFLPRNLVWVFDIKTNWMILRVRSKVRKW